MEKSSTLPKGWPLFGLYALLYGAQFITVTYFPIYLGSLHFASWAIGLMTAAGFASNLIAYNIWGQLADHASTKNRIMLILLSGGFIVSLLLLFPRLHTFIGLLLITFCLYFFVRPAIPLCETMAMQGELAGWIRFSNLRATGSFSYAVIGLTLVLLPNIKTHTVFLLYSILVLLTIPFLLRSPKLPGYRREASLWAEYRTLLSIRSLHCVWIFAFIINILVSFRLTFFPVYFTATLGYSKQLMYLYTAGLILLQIPIMTTAHRYLNRFNAYKVMLASCAFAGLGYLVAISTKNQYLLAGVNVFHSLSTILSFYSLSSFVFSHIPETLKSSGQGLLSAITGGLSPIFANVLGGWLSSLMGNIYWALVVSFLLSIVTLLIFSVLFRGKKENTGVQQL